jgi:hypothetical protein
MISDILIGKTKEQIYSGIIETGKNCAFFRAVKRDKPEFFDSAIEAIMAVPSLDIIVSAEDFIATGRSPYFGTEEALNAALYLWKLAGLSDDINYTVESAILSGVSFSDNRAPAAHAFDKPVNVYYLQRFDP